MSASRFARFPTSRAGRPSPPRSRARGFWWTPCSAPACEEGREAFRQRVCTALWGLQEKHGGENVAVVTHAASIYVFVLDVLGLFWSMPVGAASTGV